MRDPKRIKIFNDELTSIWEQYPDLRFGQFIEILISYIKDIEQTDFFYIEDDKMLSIIKDCFLRNNY